jgi:hypothetical protein
MAIDPFMLTPKEIEAIKKRLKEDAEKDETTRSRESALRAYERKSNAKAKKASNSKASQRDIFTKGSRISGSGFSKK